MKKFFLLALLLVSTSYTVQPGDSLQSIAEKFCNGTDRRQIAEFREGIREINYSIIGEYEVTPGMVITINHFERGN